MRRVASCSDDAPGHAEPFSTKPERRGRERASCPAASMSPDTPGGWSMALSDNVHAHDGRARSGRVGCHARKDARVRPEFCTLWVRHGSGLPCGLEASAALKDSSPTCAMARARKIQASAPALAQGGNSSSRAAPARPRWSARAQRA